MLGCSVCAFTIGNAQAILTSTIFVGMVAESLRAGPYTYLRVRTAEDERWVVTMDPPPPPLARVAVHSHGLRRDHHSRRLDRRFAALDFAAVRVATDNEETTP